MSLVYQLLTDREFKYAERRFRRVRFLVEKIWITFISFIVLGAMLIYGDDGSYLIGIGMIVFSFLLMAFFLFYGILTTFEIDPKMREHDGFFNLRQVSFGQYKHSRLFLDDFMLYIPDGLDPYINELAVKYENQKVKVLLAACQETRLGEVNEHYTPLKIMDDLCIDSAIKNYGTDFLKKTTYQLYLDGFIILLIIFSLAMFLVLGIRPGDGMKNPVTLIIFTLAGSYFIFKLYLKFIPRYTIDIKERMKCTCSTT